MASDEIKAMGEIAKILSSLEDEGARKRVLQWASGRFGLPPTEHIPRSPGVVQDSRRPATDVEARALRELSGIAVLQEDGTIRFTIRDVKAKSANDAAVRLALVAILAHERLTGCSQMSSRKVLVPLLKDWRIHGRHSRREIHDHRGIVRNGDSLSLDFHAKAEAERILAELSNTEVTRKWSPDRVGERRKGKRASSRKKS